MLSSFLSRGVLASAVFASCVAAVTTVDVNGTAAHTIPPLLFGQMFEATPLNNVYHRSQSGDGGIYAELLQNRAFQQVKPNTDAALLAWAPINGASIKVIADPSPLSNALPNSLELTIPSGISGQVGFGNEGYWGINVNSSWTYNASFYYKFPSASKFSGKLTVMLRSSTGSVYASASVPVSGSTTTWTQVAVPLTPTSSPASVANNFTVTVDGASASEETINFAMFSLFPPTFKGRANGLRMDIAQTLYDMKPSFFRLPGGNNLGQSVSTRWQWNATVGNLIDRPGRMGDWGYINTDGLGLLEYMYLCEDMEMEPIMAVWAGYSLGGESLPENELTPYIQQAIDQINFVIGDHAKSEPAALRASLGHPEPFPLQYIEIGNEDFFASESYIYRWKHFAGNLTANFPQLKFIATSSNHKLDPIPKQYDNHVYQTPGWFAENAFYYDSFERDGTYYFAGEYAVVSTNASNLYGTSAYGRLMYPDMQGSSGEAAFMTGLERNSDIIFAASYAPLLMNVADSKWTPNLISFDASQVYPSTSFYTQQLFSLNRGTEYLPSTLHIAEAVSLHWSVTRDAPTNTVIIKIANTGTSAEDMSFELPFEGVHGIGTATVLSGSATASNSPEAPDTVKPVTSQIKTGKSFPYTAPAYSVNVLRVKLQ
ncbi:glycoside hydrolase family 51 protein [Suillus paluster]|uniref:glycoside hydrolase family 51 protein n=1 Tax=Suillus paluster TaxID=48578 RepID=UPI001B8872AE|nr:glycoside hydrolase family 51 protein [Suillus paluster]KAG1730852.1 glycoside hydrolase family 51 protein [Suillus paluster]